MYYVWQQRIFSTLSLPSNLPIEVIHPGIRNHDAGPDFFNAKVKVGETVWAGNIEMHVRASDWVRHHHTLDAAYNSVILHVVLIDDTEITLPDGRTLLQVVMHIPEAIAERYRHLTSSPTSVASAISCREHLQEVPRVIWTDWLTSLATQRMMNKVQRVRDLLDDQSRSWQEACYVMLARSLGTGLNSDAFERMARSLPYAFIQKHVDQPLQVEALLFGQAGFLESSRPSSEEYYNRLQTEYRFLRAKFSLTPMPESSWRMARLRPQAFPHVRIAFFAAMLCSRRDFFSELLSTQTPEALRDIFRVTLRGFWSTHYTFQLHEPTDSVPFDARSLGMQTRNSMLINAVAPLLMAYGEWQGNDEMVQRSIRLLESIPAEQNRYVRVWQDAGMLPFSAFDTQAFLQLYREYCELHRCLHCRVGCWLMRH